MTNIHLNYLPKDDENLLDADNFDREDPATWADTSYAGNERDLAYLLDDDTMEWYNVMMEYSDDTEMEGAQAFGLFNLLMMHKAAFLSMIDLGGGEPADAIQLRLQVQADANDDSGTYFALAMNERWTHWKRLQDMAAKFRRNEYAHQPIQD